MEKLNPISSLKDRATALSFLAHSFDGIETSEFRKDLKGGKNINQVPGRSVDSCFNFTELDEPLRSKSSTEY